MDKPLFLSIGTGPGMGYETALRFAKAGFDVVLCARNVSRLQELAAKISAQCQIKTAVRRADAACSADLEALALEFAPSAVHFNAAIVRGQTLEEAGFDDLKGDLEVGAIGCVLAAKAFIPKMIQRGEGTFLITGGGFAFNPSPQYLALSIAKAVNHSLVQALFSKLKEQNVHLAELIVSKAVFPGSKEAAEAAELFYKLYAQDKAHWGSELAF